MYRRPKFLELLHEIREEMSREAHYDVDLFAEMVRHGQGTQPETQKTTEKIVKLETLIDLAQIKNQKSKI